MLLNDSFEFCYDNDTNYNCSLTIDDITNNTDILKVIVIEEINIQFCDDKHVCYNPGS